MNFPHKATYWSKGERNKFGGVSYKAPVIIDVFWQKKRTLMLDAKGNEEVYNTIAYSGYFIDVEGYLLLGKSVETDPTAVNFAMPIKVVSRTPNVNNTKSITKVWL